MNNDKKLKNLSTTILIKGIVMVLLGIIHSIYCYFEYVRVSKLMSEQLAFEFAIWFFATGVFILFNGMVDILSYKGLKAQQNTAWRMALLSSLFIGFTGLCGVLGFKFEPGPPYLLLLSGVWCAIPLMASRKLFSL